MSKKRSWLGPPLSSIIGTFRAVCSRVSPWSFQRQGAADDDDSPLPVKVTAYLSLLIQTKIALRVLASFWGVSMSDVVDIVVMEVFNREEKKWPPKTSSRRVNKHSKNEWGARDRKRERGEERAKALYDKRMAYLSELDRRLNSPSQTVREEANAELLKLVNEVLDSRRRRPRRRG